MKILKRLSRFVFVTGFASLAISKLAICMDTKPHTPKNLFVPSSCKDYTLLHANYDCGAKLFEISPTNNFIVTAPGYSYKNGGYIITILDLSGNCLTTFNAHSQDITSISFNYVGDRFVSTSVDKTAKIWDLSGNCLATLTGHTDQVWSAKFNHTGNLIVTASNDKTAKIWDLSGHCTATLGESGWPLVGWFATCHSASVFSAEFNNAGNRVVTTSLDCIAKVWDLSGNCKATLAGNVFGRTITFDPNHDLILVYSRYKETEVWNLNGNLLLTLECTAYLAKLSPDGNLIATANTHSFESFYGATYTEGMVKIWDLSGHCLAMLRDDSADGFKNAKAPQIQDAINSITFSSDGTRVLTASEDGSTRIWNLNDCSFVSLYAPKKPRAAKFDSTESHIFVFCQFGFELWLAPKK